LEGRTESELDRKRKKEERERMRERERLTLYYNKSKEYKAVEAELGINSEIFLLLPESVSNDTSSVVSVSR